jgi:Flp pilus assembly protein TadG
MVTRHCRDESLVGTDKMIKAKNNYKENSALSEISIFINFGKNRDGVVSIEAALIFPFMVLALLGMIDISMLLSAQRKVSAATSAVVDLSTQPTLTVNKTELNEYFSAVDSILQPYNSQDIEVELFNYRPNGGNVTLQWQHARGNCGGMPANISAEELQKLTEEVNDVLVGRVCVTFTPIVGYVLGTGSFKVDHAVAQRPRQGKTLNCTDC